MRRVLRGIVPAALVAAAPSASYADHHAGEAQAATDEPAATSHYTTAVTTLGTLFDDRKAMAVLQKHVPRLIANEQIKQARSITLKDIQGFSADTLTDEILAAIDADLAKLPAN
jgi:hypothetical protein